ncbi:peroxiredoxin family protein [Pseudobacillus badius]|uniref:peroxiredoxin family protein n=1 Tax=Bacillus badius TaxID=1455 RepID=UPI0007B3F5FF|nr:TlpA disulfide reductase family protein [Bacillus badius]KZR58726.1 hypothetical protein A3781_15540 [Bacillus badius]
MKLRIFLMVISIFIIILMLTMTIRTNFTSKEESINFDEYSNGLEVSKNASIRDPSNELVSDNSNYGLKKDDIAPDFQLKDLSGEMISLHDYKGKKVLLNFWASWCPPCKEEMPYIQKYYEEDANASNVEVVTVNMTKYEQGDIEKVREFIEQYKLSFPVLLDTHGEVMDLYNVRVFPTTYIINESGKITDVASFPLDDEIIEKLINK